MFVVLSVPSSAPAGLPGTGRSLWWETFIGGHISYFIKEEKNPSKALPIRRCTDSHQPMNIRGRNVSVKDRSDERKQSVG